MRWISLERVCKPTDVYTCFGDHCLRESLGCIKMWSVASDFNCVCCCGSLWLSRGSPYDHCVVKSSQLLDKSWLVIEVTGCYFYKRIQLFVTSCLLPCMTKPFQNRIFSSMKEFAARKTSSLLLEWSTTEIGSNTKIAGLLSLREDPFTLSFLNTVELQWLEHWWLVYHGCIELVLESLGKKKSHSCRLRIIWSDFLFYYKNGILCVHIRIASMRRF